MTKENKEGQSCQRQIDFLGGVEEGGEVKKDETLPVSIEPALPQEFVKAEKNLEWLGFFTPSNRRTRKRADEKVMSITTTVEGKKVKASVTILPSAKYGLPDTADLDKYRAFQKILSDEFIRSGKVPKHITFTSAELVKVMGDKKQSDRGGKLYKEIRDWLMRMVSTTISSEGAVWLAGQKVWASDTFHVLERVVAYGQELDDGTVADRHHVWFSDWQLENINGLYLLSIDYDLHCQLRKPVAKALLPVLQIGFYASSGSYTKRYDVLCQFLGIVRYKAKSRIKQQLEPSFKDLKNKGFLAEWDYDENKLHKTYNIIWKAGDRFYEAQEILQKREKMLTELVIKKKTKRITRPNPKQDKARQPEAKAEAVPEPKPEETAESNLEPKQEKETKPEVQVTEQPKQQPKPALKESNGESDLVEKLVAHNVTKSKAEELVARHKPEVVEEWTKAINYSGAVDKGGFLVKAISENWALPEKYLRAKDKIEAEEKWKKQQQEKAERDGEEMERQKAEAERLDGIYNSLSPERQEEVAKEAGERLDGFSKKRLAEGQTDSPMVQGMMMIRKREVVKEWVGAGRIEVEDSKENEAGKIGQHTPPDS